jgi:hypothetical protein
MTTNSSSVPDAGPDELALDLAELYLVVVDGGHRLGMPVVLQALELLVKVHLVFIASSLPWSCLGMLGRGGCVVRRRGQ